MSMVGKSCRSRKVTVSLLLSLLVIGSTLPGRAGDKEKDEGTLTNAGAVSGNDILTYGRSKACSLESRGELPRSIPIITRTSVCKGKLLHLARSWPAMTFRPRPAHKECFPC